MRFRILGPRTDAATAEEVRAAREARGWTVEQMADAVGAAPLEVSAWEAGAVAAPPLQAARVQWMLATDRWNAQTGGTPSVSGEPPPPEPDEARFYTLRGRYRRWVQRLPRWAQWPFNLIDEFAITILLAATIPDPDSGLRARVFGVGMAVLIWIVGFRVGHAWFSQRFPQHRFLVGFLTGAAPWLPATLYWKIADSSMQLGNPRLWAAAAAVSVATGLWARWRSEPADAFPAEPASLAPSAAPRLLPGTRVPGIDAAPPPHADSVADRLRAR